MVRRMLAALIPVAMLVALGGSALAAASAPLRTATESGVIPDNAVVYFVGDSITGGGGSWQPARDAFPARWRDRVCGGYASCRDRVIVKGAGGGCLVVACGSNPAVKDAWASQVLNATPKPTTVIVEIGVNDLFMGVTDQQYTDAYKHLMYSGIDAGVRVILATIPPTTTAWPWHNAHNPQRQGINGWLRGYFGSGNLLDIDSGLRIGFSGDADPCYYYINGQGDGLHPNTLGHLSIADWLDPSRIQ